MTTRSFTAALAPVDLRAPAAALVALVAIASLAITPGTGSAQAPARVDTAASSAPASPVAGAWTYILRDARERYRFGGTDARDVPDVTRDRTPLRVVQGPEFTWVVEASDRDRWDRGARDRDERDQRDRPIGPLDRRDARLLLQDNVLLAEGLEPLLVRGWGTPRVDRWDSVSVELTPGDRPRTVDGRSAEHWQLRAFVERTGSLDRVRERVRVTADLWVLPELPFSWAPFGVSARSLPTLLPRVRDRLGPRLDSLGLVGRALIRTELTLLEPDGWSYAPAERETRAGEAPEPVDPADRDPPLEREPRGSESVVAFEVSGIERTEPPPSPGPIVPRARIDELDRLVLEHPRHTCRTVRSGELPAVARARFDHSLWPPLIDHMARGCRERLRYGG